MAGKIIYFVKSERSGLIKIGDHAEPWPPPPPRNQRITYMANQQAVHRKSYRWTDEDVGIFKKLSDIWGGIRPLSESEVIREATRRCLKMAEKTSKKSPIVS